MYITMSYSTNSVGLSHDIRYVYYNNNQSCFWMCMQGQKEVYAWSTIQMYSSSRLPFHLNGSRVVEVTHGLFD